MSDVEPQGLVSSMFPAKAGQWFGPGLALLAIAMFLGAVVLFGGFVNLAASEPDGEGVAALVHYAFTRSTSHHAPRSEDVPPDLHSPANVVKGGAYFGMVCAQCHSGPGVGQNPIAMSMSPRPQYLAWEVGKFSDAELYRIVFDGVKLSGMPAWPVRDRPDEVWAVVAFLRRLPRLNAAQFRKIAYGDALTAPADPPELRPTAFTRRPYAMANKDFPPADTQFYASPSIGWNDFGYTGEVLKGCARCHDADGRAAGRGAIPNITILHPTYLRQALLRYRSGERHSGFMLPVATQLTDGQIDALARLYTADRRANPAPDASPATLALGAQIVARGVDAARDDACANCHVRGRALPRGYPTLAGQNVEYLYARMMQFRRQAHAAGAGGNPMIAIAKRLSPDQIKAVSLHYARQPVTQ